MLLPRTKNALESFNKFIKGERTLRDRLPLSRFRVLLFDMVRNWSLNYARNLNTFSETKTISI